MLVRFQISEASGQAPTLSFPRQSQKRQHGGLAFVALRNRTCPGISYLRGFEERMHCSKTFFYFARSMASSKFTKVTICDRRVSGLVPANV